MLKVSVSVSNITSYHPQQCWKWVSVSVSNITNYYPLQCWKWVSVIVSNITNCHLLQCWKYLLVLATLQTCTPSTPCEACLCASKSWCEFAYISTGLFTHCGSLSLFDCVYPLVCLHTMVVCLSVCVWPLVCLHTVAICLFVYVHWSVCILWQSVSLWLCMSAGLFTYCGGLSLCRKPKLTC